MGVFSIRGMGLCEMIWQTSQCGAWAIVYYNLFHWWLCTVLVTRGWCVNFHNPREKKNSLEIRFKSMCIYIERFLFRVNPLLLFTKVSMMHNYVLSNVCVCVQIHRPLTCCSLFKIGFLHRYPVFTGYFQFNFGKFAPARPSRWMICWWISTFWWRHGQWSSRFHCGEKNIPYPKGNLGQLVL